MASSAVIFSIALALHLWIIPAVIAQRQSYVVYMGSHPQRQGEGSSIHADDVTASHHDFLGSFLGREKAQDSIFYSYTRFINGFAAILHHEDAKEIEKSPEVLAVFPNTARQIQTTRSWEFIGLETGGVIPAESLWTKARFGEDVIIGNFDTGVWPESPSFSDEGLGPVPSRWKGTCERGLAEPVNCNRKLIGARFFNKGFRAVVGPIDPTLNTARDTEGHGTHTLATAGGSFTPRSNVFGFGNGTAKGGSPRARLASYRVCWPRVNGRAGCFDADILAAFDAAISDGVDVLSLSIAGQAVDYFKDGVAIGSFHAVKKGISVICAAGNFGPAWTSVTNVAPWILTVAASTMDREFPAYATLGNGTRLKGQSLSTSSLPQNQFFNLIVSSAAPSADSRPGEAELCFLESLNPEKVKGKIVICAVGNVTDIEKSAAVTQAGGIGMILLNLEFQGYDVEARPFFLPAVSLSYEDGITILAYANSVESPRASISAPSTQLDASPAPFMAYFSSRGPNIITPEILKPDITAPGARVIAAFAGESSPSGELYDTRRVPFNILSGTSMSCPHISGIVGLLKTIHPDWSPAAIKSAIMTTATTKDNKGEDILDSFFSPATSFSYGSGHVQPNRAADPGLVYDITPDDYLDFLCASGYDSSLLSSFVEDSFSCPLTPPRLVDLNYPSITVPSLNAKTIVKRRLKNVGPPSIYTAHILPPRGISVIVEPDTLVFTRDGEEKAFSITLEVKPGAPVRSYVYGSLRWSDSVHNVTSPLIIGVI
ncbi:subtilisin-like protease SBT5.3 isoform X2 [Wolffia australiana]